MNDGDFNSYDIINITSCYSLGIIDNFSGGIIGIQANENAQAGNLKVNSSDLETIDSLLNAAELDIPHPFHS